MTIRASVLVKGAVLCGILLLVLPLEAQARLHYSLLASPPRPLPSRVLVMPAHVQVSELFAGGVMEKVPAWTAAASANLSEAVKTTLGQREELSLVEFPALSPEQQAVVGEHLAIFEQVSYAAWTMTLGKDPAWEHKRRHFDYTLGDQLAFLKEQSGADTALLIIGEDVVSSGGRKAAAFFGALIGAVVPVGRSFVALAFVDLGTGDLLWMHYSFSPSRNLKDPQSARQMVQEVLAAYPGIPPRP